MDTKEYMCVLEAVNPKEGRSDLLLYACTYIVHAQWNVLTLRASTTTIMSLYALFKLHLNIACLCMGNM